MHLPVLQDTQHSAKLLLHGPHVSRNLFLQGAVMFVPKIQPLSLAVSYSLLMTTSNSFPLCQRKTFL